MRNINQKGYENERKREEDGKEFKALRGIRKKRMEVRLRKRGKVKGIRNKVIQGKKQRKRGKRKGT